jgi:hypothetical protein
MLNGVWNEFGENAQNQQRLWRSAYDFALVDGNKSQHILICTNVDVLSEDVAQSRALQCKQKLMEVQAQGLVKTVIGDPAGGAYAPMAIASIETLFNRMGLVGGDAVMQVGYDRFPHLSILAAAFTEQTTITLEPENKSIFEDVKRLIGQSSMCPLSEGLIVEEASSSSSALPNGEAHTSSTLPTRETSIVESTGSLASEPLSMDNSGRDPSDDSMIVDNDPTNDGEAHVAQIVEYGPNQSRNNAEVDDNDEANDFDLLNLRKDEYATSLAAWREPIRIGCEFTLHRQDLQIPPIHFSTQTIQALCVRDRTLHSLPTKLFLIVGVNDLYEEVARYIAMRVRLLSKIDTIAFLVTMRDRKSKDVNKDDVPGYVGKFIYSTGLNHNRQPVIP